MSVSLLSLEKLGEVGDGLGESVNLRFPQCVDLLVGELDLQLGLNLDPMGSPASLLVGPDFLIWVIAAPLRRLVGTKPRPHTAPAAPRRG